MLRRTFSWMHLCNQFFRLYMYQLSLVHLLILLGRCRGLTVYIAVGEECVHQLKKIEALEEAALILNGCYLFRCLYVCVVFGYQCVCIYLVVHLSRYYCIVRALLFSRLPSARNPLLLSRVKPCRRSGSFSRTENNTQ